MIDVDEARHAVEDDMRMGDEEGAEVKAEEEELITEGKEGEASGWKMILW